MRWTIFLFAALLLLPLVSTAADTPEETIRTYLASPAQTPGYYYNLGTLYLKLNQYGKAVAYLEKAIHLSPHDTDIQHNLRIAQNALGRLIGNGKLDPSSNWVELVADRVSLDEVRGAIGVFGLILILLWLRAYRSNRRILRALAEPSGVIGLIGFTLIAGLYLSERVALPAAVALDRTVVRSGPGERYSELAQIEPGIKIRLMETNIEAKPGDAWEQVRYMADGIGWVPASSLLLLSTP